MIWYSKSVNPLKLRVDFPYYIIPLISHIALVFPIYIFLVMFSLSLYFINY